MGRFGAALGFGFPSTKRTPKMPDANEGASKKEKVGVGEQLAVEALARLTICGVLH